MSEYFRTQYEKCYEGDEYYWGLEPASFLDELIQSTNKEPSELTVLDIGCGEGKDAVYMAQQQRDSLSEIGRKHTGTIYRDIEASRMFVEHCSTKDVGDLQRKRRTDLQRKRRILT